MLNRAEDDLGGLHYAHLDWLGGALARTAGSDPQKLRLIYQEAADAVAEIAGLRKIVFVVYAQAHAKDGQNIRKVGLEHAAECKGLHRNMVTCIGISGIKPKEQGQGEGNAEAATYNRAQWLYLGKSRESEGGLIPFDRAFDQMRMDPPNERRVVQQ